MGEGGTQYTDVTCIQTNLLRLVTVEHVTKVRLTERPTFWDSGRSNTIHRWDLQKDQLAKISESRIRNKGVTYGKTDFLRFEKIEHDTQMWLTERPACWVWWRSNTVHRCDLQKDQLAKNGEDRTLYTDVTYTKTNLLRLVKVEHVTEMWLTERPTC